MPFGYQATYTLDIGSSQDTRGALRLEPSKFLSEPKNTHTGTFRELDGVVNVIFKPEASIKNAEVKVEVEGENVTIDSPRIDMAAANYVWDYDWVFSREIPDQMKGNAYIFDGYAVFDGKSTLAMADSKDHFENGPFTVYVKWRPKNNRADFQQIVGHYNWEVFQDGDKVRFLVGRMNGLEGPFYEVSVPVKEDFFNETHELMASYLPGENGRIELIIDGNAYQTSIGSDVIMADYNGDRPLSLGRSGHAYASYYKGDIYRISFSSKKLNLLKFPNTTTGKTKTYEITEAGSELRVPLFGQGRINKIKITVKKPRAFF